MNAKRYEYKIGETFLDYEFYSLGPKGTIKKAVRFTPIFFLNSTYYNLSFGDYNEKDETIDDLTVTNNMDTERILSTVAYAVIDFMNHYPDAVIYARGSTSVRTRRYQMGISKYLNKIDPSFEIFGLIEDEGFKLFKQNQRYEAFVLRKKKE
jgi:hypothetical protein